MEKEKQWQIEQQKMLLAGIEHIEDNAELATQEKKESLPLYKRVWLGLLLTLDYLTPHRGKIARIEGEFVQSVASFFLTYRFLNALSVINLIAYLQLFYKQNFQALDGGSLMDSFNSIDHSKVCSTNQVPCFTLYSAFKTKDDASFSLNLFVFFFIVFISCLIKWVQFDYSSSKFEVFKAQKYQISAKIFNIWDWDIKNESHMRNHLKSNWGQIDFEINITAIMDRINSRSTSEKIVLNIRRFISATINFAILCGGVFLVIKVQDQDQIIIEYLTQRVSEDSFLLGVIP